jgi:hypothetical protein
MSASEQRFDSLEQLILNQGVFMKERFDLIDRKFEGIDRKFEAVDNQLEFLAQNFVRLDDRIDATDANLEKLRKETLHGFDQQMVILLRLDQERVFDGERIKRLQDRIDR